LYIREDQSNLLSFRTAGGYLAHEMILDSMTLKKSYTMLCFLADNQKAITSHSWKHPCHSL